MFQASVCLWDGQAGAAGLSGARQSRQGSNSTEKDALHSSYSQTWLHLLDGVFVFFCGIFLVWEGAYNHYPLQLHQTREGSTLPGADEREGGHTVVH